MKHKPLHYWLEYIQTLGPKEVELSLDRIKPIYKKIVEPKLCCKIIVVGGTNGKGSAVEFLSQLLILKNRKIGTFTSPHLFNFNERIRVNGKPVSDKLITESFELIEKNRGSTQLTYFDFSTLAALVIFNDLNLDYIVLEIGLGGRLDPVNVVDSDLSILTNVELDHQNWLGNDLEAIGKEKAAIFRFQKPVILGQHSIPKSVIKMTNKLQNHVFKVGKDFDYKVDDLSKKWSYKLVKDKAINLPSIELNNLSVSSLSCALTAFFILEDKLDLDVNFVLSKTNLKGRCELIKNRFLVDVSHNEASAEFLSSFVERNFKKDRELIAVLGVMSDKVLLSIVKPFLNKVSKWYVTTPDIPRSMNSKDIRKVLEKYSKAEIKEIGNVRKACLIAHEETHKDSLILIFGSFYTVAEAFSSIKLLKLVA